MVHGLEYGGDQRGDEEMRRVSHHELDLHVFRVSMVIETVAKVLLRRATRRTVSCRQRPNEQSRLRDLDR